VRQAQTAVQTAQAALAAAKATGRPDVAIVGNYVYTPDASGFVAVQHSWNISANLSIPVFTSGLVHARIREAQANLKAAQDALTQAQQGVGLDVRSAILNIHNAEERRRTAAANVTQAAEALRIARVRFESGVSTLVEVTDAEVALTQARTNQVNAEYDYLVAQANLKKATGALLSSVRAALGVDAK
jgi:outer membrane protein TolC